MSHSARHAIFSWVLILTLLLSSCSLLTSRGEQDAILQAGTRTPGGTVQPSTTLAAWTQAIRIEASSTRPADTATPTPREMQVYEGKLDEEVSLLEKYAPRQGSEGFIIPDDQAMGDFNAAILDILAGNPWPSVQAIEKYGYELLFFRDQGEENHLFYLLREKLPIQRGWGMYVIRPEACGASKMVIYIEAPHILADEHTPQIALEAFRALHGCALLIGGAHRDANADGSADAAHDAQTIFQAVHTALESAGGEASLFLQFHGFASIKHPGYPAAILGGSPPDLNKLADLLNSITQALEKQGISTGICAEGKWEALCGESNIQAKRIKSGIFIHLELDDMIRSAPAPVIASLVEALATK